MKIHDINNLIISIDVIGTQKNCFPNNKEEVKGYFNFVIKDKIDNYFDNINFKKI